MESRVGHGRTAGDRAARARPAIEERVAARAMALVVDPGTPAEVAADALLRLAREDAVPLQRARQLLRARDADRPGHLAKLADGVLDLALQRLALGADAVPGGT
jgi:hypothetical protein